MDKGQDHSTVVKTPPIPSREERLGFGYYTDLITSARVDPQPGTW